MCATRDNMTMIQWILLLLIHKTRSELSKPNIVFVMSDDVGYADVSFTEKIFEKNEHLIRTPRLDELASKGTILANHYSHSTCTPSRASFLTGRYAGNTGLNFAMLPGSVAVRLFSHFLLSFYRQALRTHIYIYI